MSHVEIDHLPELDAPVLIGALAGWVDAGRVGGWALDLLVSRLGVDEPFARVELESTVDLRVARPTVHGVEAARRITWPTVDLWAGNLGVDVVLVHGREPSLHWQSLGDEIAQLAARLEVRRAYFLGGMPTATSHRWPVTVAASAAQRALVSELGPRRDDYMGPTGFQTVLQVALGALDIEAAGLWAQVPGYLASAPSPPATAAVLRRLVELTGLEVALDSLDDQVDAYQRRIEDGLVERPDVADAIRVIERGAGGPVSPVIPTGDELAREIERFLRDQ